MVDSIDNLSQSIKFNWICQSTDQSYLLSKYAIKFNSIKEKVFFVKQLSLFYASIILSRICMGLDFVDFSKSFFSKKIQWKQTS